MEVAACLATVEVADEIQIESILCGLGDCLAVSNGVDFNQVSGLNVVYNMIKDSFFFFCGAFGFRQKRKEILFSHIVKVKTHFSSILMLNPNKLHFYLTESQPVNI